MAKSEGRQMNIKKAIACYQLARYWGFKNKIKMKYFLLGLRMERW